MKSRFLKSKTLTFIAAMTLFAALAIPGQLAAQDNQAHHKHHHYQVIDMGTFGGPSIPRGGEATK